MACQASLMLQELCGCDSSGRQTPQNFPFLLSSPGIGTKPQHPPAEGQQPLHLVLRLCGAAGVMQREL